MNNETDQCLIDSLRNGKNLAFDIIGILQNEIIELKKRIVVLERQKTIKNIHRRKLKSGKRAGYSR